MTMLMFERERGRGHRVVGPVRAHEEVRHWVAGGIIAASLLAAGVGAYSASESAAAASAQSRRQARAARQQAEYAELAAAADARTKARQYERQLGTIRARYGASGVIPDEGSPLLVLLQSEEEAALDVARVRHGGAAAAHGLGIEATEALLRGQQAKRQGKFQSTAAVLTGVSRGATAYAKYKTPTPARPNYGAYDAQYGP